MKYGYLLLLLLLPATGSWAQKISNIRAQATGDYVTIYYDLEGTLAGQLFKVELYSSHNQFQAPLHHVRGDAGPGVTPGKKKTIEWGAQKELASYQGEIIFEVKAQLVFSPIVLQTPQANDKYRRGKSYILNWWGGVEGENLHLELLREGMEDKLIAEVPNKGSYIWEIPAGMPVGNNYRLRISNQTGKASQTSENFTIKRRVSSAVKFVPLGILASAGLILLGRNSSGGEDIPTPLPEPFNHE